MANDNQEAELDALTEQATRLISASKDLERQAREAVEKTEQWRKQNNLSLEAQEKFVAILSDEDKAKMKKDAEDFQAEVNHDLDAAVAAFHTGKTKSKGGKKPRKLA